MSNIPANIYPLSTAGEIAIPFDVARPIGVVKATAVTTIAVTVNLPGELNVCSVYFEKDTYLHTVIPAPTITPNLFVNGPILCKGGMIVDLYLPQQVGYQAVSEDTTGFINVLETWVQMNNTGTYGVS